MLHFFVLRVTLRWHILDALGVVRSHSLIDLVLLVQTINNVRLKQLFEL